MHGQGANRLRLRDFHKWMQAYPEFAGTLPGTTAAKQSTLTHPVPWFLCRLCPDNGTTERLDAPRCARFPPVKRTVAALLSVWALMLVLAPAALADEGVGLAGPTTDKTVTFFCFGVIFFFAALVIVLSLIQGKLEKRKEQRRSDLARFN
jgi:hypothetical protein